MCNSPFHACLIWCTYPVWPLLLFRISCGSKALSWSSWLPNSWLKTWSCSLWARVVHKRSLWRWERLSLRRINTMARWWKSWVLKPRSKVGWRCPRSPLEWREVCTARTTVHFTTTAIACSDFLTCYIRTCAMFSLVAIRWVNVPSSLWVQARPRGLLVHKKVKRKPWQDVGKMWTVVYVCPLWLSEPLLTALYLADEFELHFRGWKLADHTLP